MQRRRHLHMQDAVFNMSCIQMHNSVHSLHWSLFKLSANVAFSLGPDLRQRRRQRHQNWVYASIASSTQGLHWGTWMPLPSRVSTVWVAAPCSCRANLNLLSSITCYPWNEIGWEEKYDLKANRGRCRSRWSREHTRGNPDNTDKALQPGGVLWHNYRIRS